MEKHCGMLQRVGDLTGGQMITPVDEYGREKVVGQVRVATSLNVVQIGNTTLKKVRCEDDLFPHLQPGREACLYVFRLLWTPVLLGIKYADGGKHLVTSSYVRGTILQLIVIWPFMWGIPGLIVGGMLGSAIGIPEALGGLGFVAGAGYAWWNAFKFWQDVGQAKAD
jgi:hypothetical protein